MEVNLKRKESAYDGKKALIIGKHPHAGTLAVCLGREYALNRLGLVFKREDTGEEFFVFEGFHIKWQ